MSSIHMRRSRLAQAGAGLVRTFAAAIALVSTMLAHADESTASKDDVTIYGRRDSTPAVGTADSGATEYLIGGDGIELFGGVGATNPYTAISHLPSVNAPALDSYGMANVPGGTKGLRVRGELATHGGAGTVEGLPLTGINPGPGYQWLFDMENFAAVSLAQGPIAPNRLSLFTTVGSLDSQLLWPLAQRELYASQALGSSDFRRTFARFDTGRLGSRDTALFLSGSETRADKWRGVGHTPDGRHNVEAGLQSQLSDRFEVRLYGAYNDMDGSNYRALTYAQAKDLKTYRDYDYAATSSATSADAVNYYGYNQQSFVDWTLLSEVSYAWSGDLRLVVKPFFTHENGEYLDGMANGRVRRWLIDHEDYGATAELQSRFAATEIKLGYWWNRLKPPGPPTAWKMYTPNVAGELGFASWSILSRVTDQHEFNSVYALADRDFSSLNVQGGVRYVRQTLAGIDAYTTTGVGDVSYDRALASSPGIIANRSVNSFSRGEALPFLAFRYRLTPLSTLKLAMGRNYGVQSFDVWPVYQSNVAGFLARGITADQLWRSLRPEIADAVDLGAHIGSAESYVEPTLFYSRNRDKSVSYDPGIGIAYSQNMADTKAYGAQLAAGWKPRSDVSAFATASYNRNVFNGNLPTLSGVPLVVDGLQLPDAPKWLGSAGVEWRYQEISTALTAHYNGSRYGDTQHTQRIDDYVTVNFDLNYRHKLSAGRLDMGLSADNLFDKRYIGLINASYYQLLSNSSAIYYPGAPFTLTGKIAVTF
ncbi:MAG: TonB-dependent receptor [Gammaproteobacteria bacterium]